MTSDWEQGMSSSCSTYLSGRIFAFASQSGTWRVSFDEHLGKHHSFFNCLGAHNTNLFKLFFILGVVQRSFGDISSPNDSSLHNGCRSYPRLGISSCPACARSHKTCRKYSFWVSGFFPWEASSLFARSPCRVLCNHEGYFLVYNHINCRSVRESLARRQNDRQIRCSSC